MPLLKYGRQWSRQARTWSALQFMRPKRPTDWKDAEACSIACAHSGCRRTNSKVAYEPGIPFFEGRDVCSRSCLKSLILNEAQLCFPAAPVYEQSYSHRMPLGLLMLSRKWITRDQLATALGCQREKGKGRIGEWLIAGLACNEETVARAIAAQWGIPMLTEQSQSFEAATLVPGLLSEAFSAVPVRVAAQRILYLAVEQEVHPSFNLAIEKMTGLRVEPVVLPDSFYRTLEGSAFKAPLSPGRIFHSSSVNHLCDSILALVDEAETGNMQIAALGRYVWVKLLRKHGEDVHNTTEDMVFSCGDPSILKELKPLRANFGG